MIITNHVVAGAVIGSCAPGPASAFALGVVSHAVMDATPHWGHPDYAVFIRVAVVDGLVGLAALTAFARWSPPERRFAIVAGMLGACAPDADKPSRLFFGRSPYPAWFDLAHQRIQNEAHHRMPREMLAAAVGVAVVGTVLRRGRTENRIRTSR